ncbi:MAG TPA: hypothetical protein VIL72_09360 [Beijerinckiaceae bacterium]|jgi:hypothetical protein
MVVMEHISAQGLDEVRAAIAQLVEAGRVEAGDIARLRGLIADAAGLTRGEVEGLFQIERTAQEKSPDWVAFFVDCVTDHLVWQQRPTGAVTSTQAEWLLVQADACRSVAAFAALVNVLAEADRVPAWLPAAVRGRAAQWPDLAGALRARHAVAA